jgi:hypothetical protein
VALRITHREIMWGRKCEIHMQFDPANRVDSSLNVGSSRSPRRTPHSEIDS